MSPRITRSSTRQAASQVAPSSTAPNPSKPNQDPPGPAIHPTGGQLPSRKRKASAGIKQSVPAPQSAPADRRSKRQKIPEPSTPAPNASIQSRLRRKGTTSAVMEGSRYAAQQSADNISVPLLTREHSGQSGPSDITGSTSPIPIADKRRSRTQKSSEKSKSLSSSKSYICFIYFDLTKDIR